MERDLIGEVAAELKLSRAKVLAVLDLWEAKCAEDTPERRAFISKTAKETMSRILAVTAAFR